MLRWGYASLGGILYPFAGWCSCAVPRGSYPGGVPPVRGARALRLRLSGVWVHTLAGSPLGRAWRYPRVAQRCNEVVGCPNYELGPRWLLRTASGVPWLLLLMVAPGSGLPRGGGLPHVPVEEKKKTMHVYWLNSRMTIGCCG